MYTWLRGDIHMEQDMLQSFQMARHVLLLIVRLTRLQVVAPGP